MKLCSACLLGVRCRHDGKSKPSREVLELSKKERLIPVCPEQLGGLPTPRDVQEVENGTGESVLDGRSRVMTRSGKDITMNSITGAQETLKIARLTGANGFIGKARSPSCGSGEIYDGTFSGKTVKGDGVTAALLKRNGIEAFTEEDCGP